MDFGQKLKSQYDPKRECEGTVNRARNDYDLPALRDVFMKIFKDEVFEGVRYTEQKIAKMPKYEMCDTIKKAYKQLDDKSPKTDNFIQVPTFSKKTPKSQYGMQTLSYLPLSGSNAKNLPITKKRIGQSVSYQIEPKITPLPNFDQSENTQQMAERIVLVDRSKPNTMKTKSEQKDIVEGTKAKVEFVNFYKFGAAIKFMLSEKNPDDLEGPNKKYAISWGETTIDQREKEYISADFRTTIMYVDDRISGFAFFSIGADFEDILYAKGIFSVTYPMLAYANDLVNYVFDWLLNERKVEYIHLDVDGYFDSKDVNMAFMCATYKAVATENGYFILFSKPQIEGRYRFIKYDEDYPNVQIDKSCMSDYLYIIVSKAPNVENYKQVDKFFVTNKNATKVPKRERKNIAFPETKLQKNESCLNGYQIKEELGKGEFGKVYNACKTNCTYAIKKLAKLDKKEIEIGHWMGEEGIGPKLYSYWFCAPENIWYVVYEKIDGMSVAKFKEQNNGCLPKNVLSMIKKKVKKMHKLGVNHADLHSNNIMLQINSKNEVTDAFIIDFGLSYYYTNGLSGTMIWNDNHRSLSEIKVCEKTKQKHKRANWDDDE